MVGDDYQTTLRVILTCNLCASSNNSKSTQTFQTIFNMDTHQYTNLLKIHTQSTPHTKHLHNYYQHSTTLHTTQKQKPTHTIITRRSRFLHNTDRRNGLPRTDRERGEMIKRNLSSPILSQFGASELSRRLKGSAINGDSGCEASPVVRTVSHRIVKRQLP